MREGRGEACPSDSVDSLTATLLLVDFLHSCYKGNHLTGLNSGGSCPGKGTLLHSDHTLSPIHALYSEKGT